MASFSGKLVKQYTQKLVCLKSNLQVFCIFISFTLIIVNCANPKVVSREEGMIAVNGTELFYRIIGDGDPILFVHGGPSLNHEYFLPHMESLADSYKLVFYDQRASGRSSGEVDSTAVSMDIFADDIEALRKSLSLGKIHLAGHSWGGVLGMWYAVKYPENLSSFILINSDGANTEFTQEGARTALSRFTDQDNADRGNLMNTDGFKNRTPEALTEFFKISFRANFYDRSFLDSTYLAIPENFGVNSVKLQYLGKDLLNYDLYDKLPAITCPTLIIHGDFDANPLRSSQKIQETIPGAELVVLENSGHFPFIETKDAFFGELRKFLQTVTR